MLSLGRKINDRTTITVPPSATPTEITVTLLETRPDKARLGFEAPREVRIMRDEAVEQKS